MHVRYGINPCYVHMFICATDVTLQGVNLTLEDDKRRAPPTASPTSLTAVVEKSMVSKLEEWSAVEVEEQLSKKGLQKVIPYMKKAGYDNGMTLFVVEEEDLKSWKVTDTQSSDGGFKSMDTLTQRVLMKLIDTWKKQE